MKNYFLVGLLFLLVGCQTPHTFYFPATTGQIPEVSGGLWDGSAELHMASAAGVEIIRDIKTNPPSTDNTTTNSGLFLTGTTPLISLGMSESIDIYLSKGFGLRYQYLGQPKKEGWKGTVFANLLSTGIKTSGGTASNGVYEFNAETSMSGTEVGTSFGYSPVPGNTIFVTLSDSFGVARTKVTQPGNLEFNYDDRYNEFLISTGAHIGSAWFFQYEVSLTYVQWPRIANTWVGGGNLGFGYQW